jgi:hypothetical protein
VSGNERLSPEEEFYGKETLSRYEAAIRSDLAAAGFSEAQVNILITYFLVKAPPKRFRV